MNDHAIARSTHIRHTVERLGKAIPFVKRRKYAGQPEYRFVVEIIGEPTGKVLLMEITDELRNLARIPTRGRISEPGSSLSRRGCRRFCRAPTTDSLTILYEFSSLHLFPLDAQTFAVEVSRREKPGTHSYKNSLGNVARFPALHRLTRFILDSMGHLLIHPVESSDGCCRVKQVA